MSSIHIFRRVLCSSSFRGGGQIVVRETYSYYLVFVFVFFNNILLNVEKLLPCVDVSFSCRFLHIVYESVADLRERTLPCQLKRSSAPAYYTITPLGALSPNFLCLFFSFFFFFFLRGP